MVLVLGFWTFLRALFFGSAAVALENVALRHQLLVLQRSVGRPRLARWDRVFWVWLSRVWASWRSSLVIVQPATVLAWHRRGFQLYWRWKSRALGRPPEARPRASPSHPAHGSRESHLGPPAHPRRTRPPRLPRRRTDRRKVHAPDITSALPDVARFSGAHLRDIVAVDFFVVPTLTFRLLFVFIILRHDPRKLLHLDVTVMLRPSGRPSRSSRRSRRTRLRPTCSGFATRSTVRCSTASYGIGMREVPAAPRAPWRDPFVERVIGSCRECLDHFFVLNEAHLRRLLRRYLGYYDLSRPIQRSATTAPTRETSDPLRGTGLRPFLRSAGSITVTGASPDRELARRWPHGILPARTCPTRSPRHRLRRYLSTTDSSAPGHARDAERTFKGAFPADQCQDQVSDRDRCR